MNRRKAVAVFSLASDGAGRLSAQLMDPGCRMIGGSPTGSSAAAIRDASPADMRDILTGFTAYFGTFYIDESSQTVLHHVQAHLIPSWVGTGLRRTIPTVAFDQGTNRLVWRRDST